MVWDNHSSRMYVWIRRMIPIALGMAFNIWEDSHSSRTYVWIRRMVLVAHGVACNIWEEIILLGRMFGLEEWSL
jgi:hypothetical protein